MADSSARDGCVWRKYVALWLYILGLSPERIAALRQAGVLG